MTDAAEVSVPEGYDEQDYLKMYAFLEMADADGVKNGTKLNEDYDPRIPPTWGYHQRELRPRGSHDLAYRPKHHLAGTDNRRGRG